MSTLSASLPMLSSACRTNPCGYGGTCIPDSSTTANGSYQCRCIPGRMGMHCEHRKQRDQAPSILILHPRCEHDDESIRVGRRSSEGSLRQYGKDRSKPITLPMSARWPLRSLRLTHFCEPADLIEFPFISSWSMSSARRLSSWWLCSIP